MYVHFKTPSLKQIAKIWKKYHNSFTHEHSCKRNPVMHRNITLRTELCGFRNASVAEAPNGPSFQNLHFCWACGRVSSLHIHISSSGERAVDRRDMSHFWVRAFHCPRKACLMLCSCVTVIMKACIQMIHPLAQVLEWLK